MDLVLSTSHFPSLCLTKSRKSSHKLCPSSNSNLGPLLSQQKIYRLCSNGNLSEALLLLHDGSKKFDSSWQAEAIGVLLQACGQKKELEIGQHIHDIISSSREFMDNAILTTRLITMYSMCGSPLDSCHVFESLEGRNLFQWNALISGYTRNELWHEALAIFCQLLSMTDLRPDNFTFPCVLKACAGFSSVKMGESVHGITVKMGICSDSYICNSLISMYGRCGYVNEATKMFDIMPERNQVSWNTLLCVLAGNGFPQECFSVFKDMLLAKESTGPDDATLVTVLPVCAGEGWLETGRAVHGLAVKLKMNQEMRVSNALVDMYSKCGFLQEAESLFDKIPDRNVVSWNAMLAGCARSGDFYWTMGLLRRMQLEGMKADEITTLNILPVCLEPSELLSVKEIHSYAIRNGFRSKELVVNSLIAAYAKCGSLKYADRVFSGIGIKTVSSWNALIGGYAQNGDPNKAIDIFLRMTLSGLDPDWFSVGSLLLACANLGYLWEGRSIHGFVQRNGLEKDSFIVVSLLSLYVQCGEASAAWKLFDRMEERNLVSWNAMISGLSQNNLPEESLQLFRQMQLIGDRPSEIAITSVFTACAQLSALRLGKETHCFALKANLSENTFICSSIIDMYAKCGSIDRARNVFERLNERDVVSWTVMIMGYGIHGRGFEAIDMFVKMRREGVKPDAYTFIGILMACNHAGLVEEGLKYFEEMGSQHGVEPKLEHYACVADMLGRAGRLADAVRLIEEMPEEADGRMWGALLGACRIHGDVGMGEEVANKLLELEPDKAEHYVLASNLFAASGRWDGVRGVRKRMKEMKLQKETGCSWIELGGEVYKFAAGDH